MGIFNSYLQRGDWATTVVQRRIYVEVAPPRRLNTTIVIGVAVALFGGGIVYINLMQKERKEETKRTYVQKQKILYYS